MKVNFIERRQQSKLILIFPGWGSDSHTFADIAKDGWDVAVIEGFDPELPDLECLTHYHTIYLYAWSLGVAMAESYPEISALATKAFAVNGTPFPCHDESGIPTDIYLNTARNLNERNLLKFRIRMCGGVRRYESVKEKFQHCGNIAALRQVLDFVRTLSHQDSVKWDKAFISANDAIFPTNNQLNYWKGRDTDIVVLHDSHHYLPLSQIIDATIVNTGKVGEKFSKSFGSSYSAHAHAQRMIAGRLATLFLENRDVEAGSVVEIGPGTGFFTEQWKKHVRAARCRFMDLCPMESFDAATSEEYLVGDAETAFCKWVDEGHPSGMDFIFSTSAIQWFSDVPRFLSNASRLLKDRGELIVSTFGPDNLKELKSMRSSHLSYLSVAQLKSAMDNLYSDMHILEEFIHIEFSSPLEAIRHLRLTGVTENGGKHASVSNLRKLIQDYPINERGRYNLTYHPIYIFGKK